MTALAIDPDERLFGALRAGDERAFATLVERYHAPLFRLAVSYVRDRAVAEEVVQDTWLGVLRGLERFEGRSQLKTWIFRILTYQAKTRAARERRSQPFSSLAGLDDEPSVDPERFFDAAHARYPGHWSAPPHAWGESSEGRLLAKETRDVIAAEIDSLPLLQRQVITLRDVEGWPSDEVCALLEISEANQRVLLHRARSRVRATLERYLD